MTTSNYKRVQSEPLWKWCNRKVATSFQQRDFWSIHCLLLPEGKEIPKEKISSFFVYLFVWLFQTKYTLDHKHFYLCHARHEFYSCFCDITWCSGQQISMVILEEESSFKCQYSLILSYVLSFFLELLTFDLYYYCRCLGVFLPFELITWPSAMSLLNINSQNNVMFLGVSGRSVHKCNGGPISVLTVMLLKKITELYLNYWFDFLRQ